MPRRSVAAVSAIRAASRPEPRREGLGERLGDGARDHDQVVPDAHRGAQHRIGIGIVGEVDAPLAARLVRRRVELGERLPHGALLAEERRTDRAPW